MCANDIIALSVGEVCRNTTHSGIMEDENGSAPVLDTAARQTAAAIPAKDQLNNHPPHADEQTHAPPTRVGKEAASMTDNNDALFEGVPALSKALGMALEEKPGKAIQIDTAKYQAYLDDPDLSDEQKEQIVKALWQIMMAFVDLGYGISPLQQACGKLAESDDESGNSDSALLSSDPTTLTETFNVHAAE